MKKQARPSPLSSPQSLAELQVQAQQSGAANLSPEDIKQEIKTVRRARTAAKSASRGNTQARKQFDADLTLTPEEAIIVRKGREELKRGVSVSLEALDHELDAINPPKTP